MATLLPFEANDALPFSDIQTSTNLPDKELCKQLQTLVDTKILLCDDVSLLVSIFIFNSVKRML